MKSVNMSWVCFPSSHPALLSQLLEGVGNHLDSTTPALRSIGQLVAEGVVTKLDEHGTQLKFEVDTVSGVCHFR